LQQNSFSDHDYNCPLWKTIGMMKAIVMFYEGCIRVILDSAKRSEQKLSMAQIEMYLGREENGDVMDRINSMKFFSPIMPKDEMKRKFDDLHNAITKAFNDIGMSRM
jgi:V-type H+-transporting ATPase subunit A